MGNVGAIFRWALWAPNENALGMLSHSIGTFQRFFGAPSDYIVFTDDVAAMKAGLQVDAVVLDMNEGRPEYIDEQWRWNRWHKWAPRFRYDPGRTEIHVDADLFLVNTPTELLEFVNGDRHDYIVTMEDFPIKPRWVYGRFGDLLPEDFQPINTGLVGQRAGCDLTDEIRQAYTWLTEQRGAEQMDFFDEQGTLAHVLQSHFESGRAVALDPARYALVSPINDPPVVSLDGLAAIHATFPERPAYWQFIKEISAISGVPVPDPLPANRVVFEADEGLDSDGLVDKNRAALIAARQQVEEAGRRSP
ncbi:hypothetical protein Acor_14760 [Acrocarpospora corrugata]|uniref:Uncharacterized protein n=1 Tax=Acrocarpospora corrugata TaxID=35763 RepID=A0A5M3VWD7_9ACTN|nr:hypothetical protein [Acrocarpospora corrugata]GER99412.1 hypothetical protein Acor_14760 [Acrocarpospora corrugata]